MIEANTFDAFFRSITYNENSSGPSIEPCGTPHIIISTITHKIFETNPSFHVK